MGSDRIRSQPTFTVLADGTGYCIRRQGRVLCVCVDFPTGSNLGCRTQRQELRQRFLFAWRHARLRSFLFAAL